jgi:hypothetical protein
MNVDELHEIEEVMKSRKEDVEQSSDEETSSSETSSEEDEESSGSSESSGSGEGSEYEIDLSDNEIYKGMYSFFEDEEGHNILDYISLLHTELIGMGKSMQNVKLIRKDMTRIADSLEKLVSMKEYEIEEKKKRKEKA